MISRLTSLTLPRGVALSLRVAAVFFTVLQLVSLTKYGITHGLAFIDGRIYLRGIEMFRAGHDPYVHFPANNFVYTPSFLRVGAWLMAHLSMRTLCIGYIAFHFSVVMALPILISRFYAKASWLKPDIAFVLFFFWPAFGSAFLMTANIASLLYIFILLAGIPGLRSSRWTAFYITVAACGVLKPPMLLFLLLPLLLSLKQWLPVCLSLAAWFAENMLERHLWPAEHAAYLDSAEHQVFGLRDLGYGVMHYSDRVAPVLHVDGDFLGRVLQTLVCFTLLAALWHIRKSQHDEARTPQWVASVLLGIMLCEPRPMKYDLPVALLPALVLCIPVMQHMACRFGRQVCLLLGIAFFLVQIRSALCASLLLFLFIETCVLASGLLLQTTASEELATQDVGPWQQLSKA